MVLSAIPKAIQAPSNLDACYKLTKEDIGKAAAVLADAFKRDPLWAGIFEHTTNQNSRLKAFSEILLRHSLHHGEAYAFSEKLEGIITHVPGNQAEITLWHIVQSGALGCAMRMGPVIGLKLLPLFEPIQLDRHNHMMGRPFIYIPIFGVAMRLQGKGYGSALLGALIARAEREGLPIYLETETEKNVAFYERFGFKTVKKIIIKKLIQPMWEMIREPS
ncbi:MAG: GNAT family N-acetyltransferase [Myxococcota bacterium]|nr:GNAT family N-acetyltransferase [Myxococcota bacterium]